MLLVVLASQPCVKSNLYPSIIHTGKVKHCDCMMSSAMVRRQHVWQLILIGLCLVVYHHLATSLSDCQVKQTLFASVRLGALQCFRFVSSSLHDLAYHPLCFALCVKCYLLMEIEHASSSGDSPDVYIFELTRLLPWFHVIM